MPFPFGPELAELIAAPRRENSEIQEPASARQDITSFHPVAYMRALGCISSECGLGETRGVSVGLIKFLKLVGPPERESAHFRFNHVVGVWIVEN